MNEVDKKILIYLQSKDKIEFGAMASEISLSGEIISEHLSPESFLMKKDFVRIEQPYCNPKFAYITEKGRKALWGRKKLFICFLFDNWLNILGTFASVIAAIASIISIKK